LDNENTENAFFDLLQDQFEFLLHIPCSSHIIQLVVKSVLKHSSIQLPLQKMIEILNEISSTKELRLKIQNMAKSENINIILTKPNATRWNSTLKAIRRFIIYKKVINYFKGNIIFILLFTNVHISSQCLLLLQMTSFLLTTGQLSKLSFKYYNHFKKLLIFVNKQRNIIHISQCLYRNEE
jgi:hypothetical protein